MSGYSNRPLDRNIILGPRETSIFNNLHKKTTQKFWQKPVCTVHMHPALFFFCLFFLSSQARQVIWYTLTWANKIPPPPPTPPAECNFSALFAWISQMERGVFADRRSQFSQLSPGMSEKSLSLTRGRGGPGNWSYRILSYFCVFLKEIKGWPNEIANLILVSVRDFLRLGY